MNSPTLNDRPTASSSARPRVSWVVFALVAVAYVLLFVVGTSTPPRNTQYIVLNLAEQNFARAFEEIGHIDGNSRGEGVGLGIAGIFSYLNESRDQCEAHLQEFLSLAVRYRIPVVVQLDGEQWWGARPDLWNWWDPARPGFDSANRMNVEWSGWGPRYALRIAWRNWGRQVRVLPPPNLMSPRYRKACHEEMRVLIPIILSWWERLSSDDKDLLIGIKLGWESSIGVNAFYYPGGNALLDSAETSDPRQEVDVEQVPARGFVPIGYSALTSLRQPASGLPQESQIAEIARLHLDDLCALAAELGVPREKTFTHGAGWKDQELMYGAAVNRYSCPGWSFYKHAYDATKDLGVKNALRRSDAPYWAAVEWMLVDSTRAEAWKGALSRTLSIPKCRYLCIYNWEGIKDIKGAVEAVQAILNASNHQGLTRSR
jgi:hypothetical protein